MLIEAAVEVAVAIYDDADGAVGVAGVADVLGLLYRPVGAVVVAAAYDQMACTVVEREVLDVCVGCEGVLSEYDGVDRVFGPAERDGFLLLGERLAG